MESNSDNVVLSGARIVFDRTVVKALQSTALEGAVEEAIHKFLSELRIVDAVAMRTIDARTFIVPVDMFIKTLSRFRPLYRPRLRNNITS